MLNPDKLLKPIIARSDKPAVETIEATGIYYPRHRQIITNKEGVKLSYLEWIVHKLGYRLELRIIDEEGNVISKCTSDPEQPLATEEFLENRRNKHTKNRREVDMRELAEKAHAARKANKERREAQAAMQASGNGESTDI